jgi:hypothetical protein
LYTISKKCLKLATKRTSRTEYEQEVMADVVRLHHSAS